MTDLMAGRRGLIMGVAAVGFLINLGTALLFMRDQHSDLNARGAYLHMMADAAVSVGVVIAGAAIMFTGWSIIDPIVSVAIVGVILWGTWGLLRDSVNLALDAAPRGVDVEAIRAAFLALPGVGAVHDLHVWAITSGVPVISAHVVVDDACISQGRSGEVLDRLSDCLGGHFDVEHCTFQLEPVGHQAHEPASHA